MRAALPLLLLACSGPPPAGTGVGAAGTGGGADTGPAADTADTGAAADPFADAVVSFEPGEGAGFGQDALPDVVLGPPHGGGNAAGSLDVLSLGCGGVIVLEMSDLEVVDGDGPDLLVFENPFSGWVETGAVAASEDGTTWHEWPCDPDDAAGGFPGCAGVHPVYADPDANDLDPTDPAEAGGDAFDLADLGLERARFVRIRDTGTNPCGAPTAGFDLDAVAAVHAVAPGAGAAPGG